MNINVCGQTFCDCAPFAKIKNIIDCENIATYSISKLEPPFKYSWLYVRTPIHMHLVASEACLYSIYTYNGLYCPVAALDKSDCLSLSCAVDVCVFIAHDLWLLQEIGLVLTSRSAV